MLKLQVHGASCQCRPGVSSLATTRSAVELTRQKVVAETGFSPALTCLKSRVPRFRRLGDRARLASPFNAFWAHRACIYIKEKNSHLHPYRSVPDWVAAGLSCGRWLVDLGPAVKPHTESGKLTSAWLGFRKWSDCTKKPLPVGEVVASVMKRLEA